MKRATKRRTFWQYNKDNGYWVVWVVASLLALASTSESKGMVISFIGVGILTVIAGWADWRRLG